MSLLGRLLPTNNVILDLDVTSKKRVFEHAGLLFEDTLGISRRKIFDALLARERLGSTGLGHGVAIPHGRIKGLKSAAGAFIRTQSPIAFEAPDGNPVNLIFVLLVPEKATDQHLQILSELAQMFSVSFDRPRRVAPMPEMFQVTGNRLFKVHIFSPSTVM